MKIDVRESHFILRVFKDGNDYGDTYEWAASIYEVSHLKWEVMGILKPPTPQIWRAMRKYADEHGITFIFKRIKDGKERSKIIKPKSKSVK